MKELSTIVRVRQNLDAQLTETTEVQKVGPSKPRREVFIHIFYLPRNSRNSNLRILFTSSWALR